MSAKKSSSKVISHNESALDSYIHTIDKESGLTPQEEAELAVRIRQGDMKAMERLVCANLRFVISEAKQYQNQGLDLEDLIAEGNLGLIKAAQKFDETQGTRFITLAKWWIKDAIMAALETNGRLIRLPHGQQALVREIRTIQARFREEKEREATIYDIAEELNMPLSKLQDVYASTLGVMSLDASLDDDDEDNTLLSHLGRTDDPMSDFATMASELETVIKTMLDEREAYIIRHSFGIKAEECTQEEIADALGLSRERVRQLRLHAIEKMRDAYQLKAIA